MGALGWMTGKVAGQLATVQIGFTFLVPAHLGCPRKRVVKCVLVFTAALSIMHAQCQRFSLYDVITW